MFDSNHSNMNGLIAAYAAIRREASVKPAWRLNATLSFGRDQA
jgi:hypothetical protein